MTLVVDATEVSIGRLSTFVAKKAMKGEEVVVVNAEKAVISGKKESLLKRFSTKYHAVSKTNPRRYGPKRPRNSDRFIRRTIRGMLPWDRRTGREAFEKVMVYVGEPKGEIMKRHNIDISKIKIEKLPVKHYDYYITVEELCKALGGTR